MHWFPPDGGQIGAEDFVSVGDVIESDRAVFQEIMMYHSLEDTLGWSCNLMHELSWVCHRHVADMLA